MMIARRTVLGAGVLAAIWATSRMGTGRAEQAAIEPDGFRLIEAGPASVKLAPGGVETQGLGYDGQTPGPALRMRLGEELKLRLLNKLDAPTTLHWLGLRIANSTAGIGDLTQAPVAPAGRFDYVLKPPDAGFALYRPHVIGAAAQIARGLYGPIVVEEASPPEIDLEAIVVLQDWRLDSDGEVEKAPMKPGEARLGQVLAANGAPTPFTLSPPPGGRVRLRLANASVARIMTISIEGVKPTIIAIDGQPSEPFEPLRNQFPIGPAARFELMFDMPRETGAAVRFTLKGGEASEIADEPDRVALVFTASEAPPSPARPRIAGLPPNPLLPKEIDLARALRFDVALAGGAGAPLTLNGQTITGPWPEKPAFRAPRNSPVTLGVLNKTSTIQAMRLGGHVGRLLHPLDDGWEPYWRDNVLVPPGKTAHLAFVADNPGRWPIESANPDFADSGLRTYFEVG